MSPPSSTSGKRKQAAWANRDPAVILNIQRQPAQTSSPSSIASKLSCQSFRAASGGGYGGILTDRTTTIRASVNDVQFTLVLTIALVVMSFSFFSAASAPHYSQRCGPLSSSAPSG